MGATQQPSRFGGEAAPSVEGIAVIFVDLQERMLTALPGSAELQARAIFVARAAGLLGIPVLATEQVPAKLGPTFPGLRGLILDEHLFAKTAFSSLRADGLRERLSDLGVQHLLVAGVETPICVYQTLLDARDLGLSATLLSDAIGARRAADAADVISHLRLAAGVPVVPSEAVFYSLLGGADHPVFRDFTQLVKAQTTPSAAP